MKTVTVQIKGLSPLLMHAFPMQAIEALEKKTPAEQAEHSAYRTPEGKLYVPGLAFQRALVAGGAYSKGKGRAMLGKTVAAAVNIAEEYLILSNQEYTIDARPVVVPATKGRVVRYRPRFNEWSFSVELEYNDNLITEAQLRRVVDDTGLLVGLLDFRVEKRGQFGRFMVTNWS
jgi:hypothetical protein